MTHKRTVTYNDQSSVAIQKIDTVTGTAEHNVSDPALAVVSNHQYVFAVTRANMQSLCISASGPVTVKTNSSGSPTDTIVISGGTSTPQVVNWVLATDGLTACPFTANVTTIYVTNAGGGAVTFDIRCLCND